MEERELKELFDRGCGKEWPTIKIYFSKDEQKPCGEKNALFSIRDLEASYVKESACDENLLRLLMRKIDRLDPARTENANFPVVKKALENLDAWREEEKMRQRGVQISRYSEDNTVVKIEFLRRRAPS